MFGKQMFLSHAETMGHKEDTEETGPVGARQPPIPSP